MENTTHSRIWNKDTIMLQRFTLACVLSAAWLQAEQRVVNDDFTVLDKSRWTADDFNWRAENSCLIADVGLPAWAVWAQPDLFRAITCEVIVTPRKRTTQGWKVAALSLRENSENFWHLALVESPDKEGKKHFIELCEMRQGRWLAQHNLRREHNEGTQFNWTYGSPYRLRLAMTPQGIDGSVFDKDGKQIAHIAYAFQAEAVVMGRPALRVSGLTAAFQAFRMTADDTNAGRVPPPAAVVFPPYAVPGTGVAATKAGTGFFTVEQDGSGRWWFVDPRGERFYAVGTDHVNYYAHFCQKLGYAPYQRACERQYGSAAAWAEVACERLRRWGFNVLGAGNIPEVRYKGLAHTLFAAFGSSFSSLSALVEKTTWTGFPNVFDPRWENYCRARADEVCRKNRRDPWLLGYFLDNELEWYGKSHREEGIWTDTMKWPATHSGKQALVEHLKTSHGTLARFNAAWHQQVDSWDDVLQLQELPAVTEESKRVRQAWLAEVAERYFRISAAAIREADPNHLIIGSRFAGNAPDWAWKACARHCDVVTFNHYPRIDFESGDLTDLGKRFQAYYELVSKPMMITEWSFPALDAGLPCRHGAGMRVDTQKQKAACYEVMQHLLFRLPFMIGSDYFMWADEPKLGISDTFPEDSNYGLVNVEDKPYPELTAMAARINPLAYPLHAGDIPEIYLTDLVCDDTGVSISLLNKGSDTGTATLRVELDGHPLGTPKATLNPGAAARLHLAAPMPLPPGVHTVTAQLDRGSAWLPRGCRGAVKLSKTLYRGDKGVLLLTNTTTARIPSVPFLLSGMVPGPAWRFVTNDRDGTFPVAPLARGFGVLRTPPLDAGGVLAGKIEVDSSAPGPIPGVNVHRLANGGFVLDNGILRLEHDGKSGNVVDRISCAGILLGSYNPLIWQQPNGQDQWSPASKLVRVDIRGLGGAVVVTVTCRSKGADAAITAVDDRGVMAERQTRPLPFESVHRILVWPRTPYIVTQCVAVTNRDKSRPLTLMAPFFYLPSFLGGKVADDRPGEVVDVPNYYRRRQASWWYDPTVGARYGCRPLDPAIQVRFWLDQAGQQHPDARLLLSDPVQLDPGQTFAPPSSSALLIFAALDKPGSPASWNRVEQLLQASENIKVMTATPSPP